MATKTLITIKDYAALDEPAGLRYELSNGELTATPSATQLHNRIRDYFNGDGVPDSKADKETQLHNRIRDYFNSALMAFVLQRELGEVTSETDLMLVGEVVRGPDVAFIRG